MHWIRGIPEHQPWDWDWAITDPEAMRKLGWLSHRSPLFAHVFHHRLESCSLRQTERPSLNTLLGNRCSPSSFSPFRGLRVEAWSSIYGHKCQNYEKVTGVTTSQIVPTMVGWLLLTHGNIDCEQLEVRPCILVTSLSPVYSTVASTK